MRSHIYLPRGVSLGGHVCDFRHMLERRLPSNCHCSVVLNVSVNLRLLNDGVWNERVNINQTRIR